MDAEPRKGSLYNPPRPTASGHGPDRRSSFAQPRSGLNFRVGGKELHGCAPKSRAGEGKRLRLPTRISDDRNLRNFVSMREHEIEIVPIGPPFPSLEVFEDGHDSRLEARINLFGSRMLGSSKFTPLQHALKARDDHVVGFVLDLYWHGVGFGWLED
jgi:hypothetical protein